MTSTAIFLSPIYGDDSIHVSTTINANAPKNGDTYFLDWANYIDNTRFNPATAYVRFTPNSYTVYPEPLYRLSVISDGVEYFLNQYDSLVVPCTYSLKLKFNDNFLINYTVNVIIDSKKISLSYFKNLESQSTELEYFYGVCKFFVVRNSGGNTNTEQAISGKINFTPGNIMTDGIFFACTHSIVIFLDLFSNDASVMLHFPDNKKLVWFEFQLSIVDVITKIILPNPNPQPFPYARSIGKPVFWARDPYSVGAVSKANYRYTMPCPAPCDPCYVPNGIYIPVPFSPLQLFPIQPATFTSPIFSEFRFKGVFSQRKL